MVTRYISGPEGYSLQYDAPTVYVVTGDGQRQAMDEDTYQAFFGQ